MARNESRAESLERLQSAAIRKIKTALKERGIIVPEIDGPAKDDAPLRNVQEWQAVASAFDEPEKSAQAENRTVSSYPSADQMDSAPDSTKTAKGK
jgi:hypothetical protein